jgi:hypothetical protein
VVFLAGLVVRHIGAAVATFPRAQEAWFDEQTFAAPRQLAAYAQHPGLVTTGYTLFAVGSVLMVPALLAFGRVVARGAPRLAYWGALLLVLAQFRRLYFGGIEVSAFRLVDTIGLSRATDWVLDNYIDLSYGLGRIPATLSVGSIVGGLVLAVGAYRVSAPRGRSRLLPVAIALLRGRWSDLKPAGKPVEARWALRMCHFSTSADCHAAPWPVHGVNPRQEMKKRRRPSGVVLRVATPRTKKMTPASAVTIPPITPIGCPSIFTTMTAAPATSRTSAANIETPGRPLLTIGVSFERIGCLRLPS